MFLLVNENSTCLFLSLFRVIIVVDMRVRKESSKWCIDRRRDRRTNEWMTERTFKVLLIDVNGENLILSFYNLNESSSSILLSSSSSSFLPLFKAQRSLIIMMQEDGEEVQSGHSEFGQDLSFDHVVQSLFVPFFLLFMVSFSMRIFVRKNNDYSSSNVFKHRWIWLKGFSFHFYL